MIAFITGASSGIGAEFARRFAEQGYDLIITGRRKDFLEQVANQIKTTHGRTVTIRLGDLSDPSHRAELAELIRNSADIDVLVNNAGHGLKKHFIEDDISNPEMLIDVHLRAAMELMHAAIPGMTMRKRGTIINVSSIAGFVPTASDPTYGATKAFLTLFTESLHLVLHEQGITMQALCPGFTWTNFHEKLGMPKEEQLHRGILRWGTVENVVDASMKGLRSGAVVVIPGLLNRVAITLVSLIPRWFYYRLMKGKKLRRR